MATYDLWLLILLAPALWWLAALVRAVLDVRARAVPMTDWGSATEDAPPYS